MKSAFLLLLLVLSGRLLAQPTAALPPAQVPATMQALGLRLVLNEEARRLVQQKSDALCRHQPSFKTRVDMADAAFPIIDKLLQQEGVPLDFRYLVLQESALQGDARSIHDAVGYWQLKREAASDMGLLVNNVVDERQHLSASTRAAARYLKRNNAELQNWLNALLSYNTGATGVKPYALPTDAGAREMSITGQTHPYVLMFLAHKVAFEPACGLNPRPPLRLQEFPAQAGQSLEAQARTIYADPTALATHNRWLLAPVVPADKPYTLLVPIGDAAQAAGLLANQRMSSSEQLLTTPELNSQNKAEVRVNNLRALIALPGETKEEMARRGKVKLGLFLRHNEMSGFDAVVPGRPYFLESKRDVAAVEYHVVQPNETVADVAQKYGIRRKAILVKNRLASHDELRPGRILWLWHTRPREVAVEYRTATEGVGLELPVGTPRPARPTPAVASRRTAEAPAAPVAAPAPAVKSAVREPIVRADEMVTVATPPQPAPAPARSRETVAALPPPVALPASAPLADELSPAPAPAPVAAASARPAPLPKPAAVETSAPVPASAPWPRAEAAAAPVASAVAPASLPATGQHKVQPRETVYGVARLYNVKPADLLAWNGLPVNAGLTVGQVLRLQAPESTPLPVAAAVSAAGSVRYTPRAGAEKQSSAPATSSHTVAAGETLFSIAKRYGVSVTDLQTWNSKADNSVKIGETLVLK